VTTEKDFYHGALVIHVPTGITGELDRIENKIIYFKDGNSFHLHLPQEHSEFTTIHEVLAPRLSIEMISPVEYQFVNTVIAALNVLNDSVTTFAAATMPDKARAAFMFKSAFKQWMRTNGI